MYKILSFFLLLSFTIDHEHNKDMEKPNIILIISDDAGYADFGFNRGNEQIITPWLDQLAGEGVICRQGYVSASVCCPSRMGLMTGRYQQRFGAECNVPVIPTPGYSLSDLGLDPGQMTMGNVLQKEGYKTSMIGKWHLGLEDHHHPLERGFDEFYGFLGGSRSYFPLVDAGIGRKLYKDRNVIKEQSEINYLTDNLTDAALDFISRQKSNPFFLYLSFNAVHTPMEAKEEDLEQYRDLKNLKRKTYAAMTKSMDDNIGRLLTFLSDQNLEKNTLIVFINDNGGATNNASVNHPLKGNKGTYWEGGIRVPFIIKWPGKIQPNTEFRAPVSTLDLLPTFISAANEGGSNSNLDGVNLLPFINGNLAKDPHAFLYWRLWQVAAIRHGPWKLIRISEDPLKSERALLGPPILVNLDDDPAESINLADEYPDVTKLLSRKLEEWEKELAPPKWYDGQDWQHWAEVQVKNHTME